MRTPTWSVARASRDSGLGVWEGDGDGGVTDGIGG